MWVLLLYAEGEKNILFIIIPMWEFYDFSLFFKSLWKITKSDGVGGFAIVGVGTVRKTGILLINSRTHEFLYVDSLLSALATVIAGVFV